MSIGITRVSMQLGTNFRISAWQPVDKENHPQAVHGNYYGLVAAAAFVGGAGDLQVSPLDAADGNPDIVGYAGYHGGKLSKIAVLNLDVWNSGDAEEKPAEHVSLSKLGDDVNEVRVSRLTAPLGATADTGITWAGRRWTAENNGTEYADGEQPLTIGVKDGALERNIVVKASEAVVVEILRG